MKYFIYFLPFLIISFLSTSCLSSSGSKNEIKNPLYRAINKGQLDEVKQFIQDGINININASGWSHYPLEYAAQEGQTEIVEYLITQGAENINIAFQLAMSRREYETAKLIYSYGELHYSVLEEPLGYRRMNTEEKIELFSLITDNQLSNNYFLLCAQPDEYNEIIEKYNIDISSIIKENGENILNIAAKRNNLDLVNYLISNKFNINSIDKNGNTALFYAVSSAGPSINWENPFYEDQNSINVSTFTIPRRGSPPFPDFQAQAERGNRIINIIKILCENGINIDSQNNLGWTALHLSYVRYADVLRELLKHYNANTNIKTQAGRLPEEFYR